MKPGRKKNRARHRPPVIGLTGLAGSGKSTVASWFRKWGAQVVEADKLGHRLLAQNSPCYRSLVECFGNKILNKSRAIDRRRLGELVFGDRRQLRRLNRLVHPELRRRLQVRIAGLVRENRGPVVLDAALILDWGLDREMDILIVVTAPVRDRLLRLRRKGYSLDQARAIVGSQMAPSRLVSRADIIIDNAGDISSLRRQAEAAWRIIAKQRTSRRQKEEGRK